MTVKEFIDGMSKNPTFLGLELLAVTKTGTFKGGQLDGAAQLQCFPVESVSMGFNGILLYLDAKTEKTETIMPDAFAKFPQLLFIGPMPDILK